MDSKAVTDDMSGIMYKFPFKLPPYYALIIRSLITLEGIALVLIQILKYWEQHILISHEDLWRMKTQN